MTKIQAIAETASDNLKRLMKDAAGEIETAMINAAKEADLQEKQAIFKLGFSISLNLDANTMDNDLSWSVKHKLSITDEIPDPNQPKLPLEDSEGVRMTITSEGDSVSCTSKDLEKLAGKVGNRNKGGEA
jgi:hypothetical protein